MMSDIFLWAYGPAPGMELIPYFLAMLAWAALAIISLFLSPITALVRRLRKGKSKPASEPPKPPDAAGPAMV